MDTNDFEVRQPRWLLILCAALLSLAVIAVAVTVAETCLKKLNVGSGSGAIAACTVIAAVSVVGIVACRVETFKYSDGQFLYKRIFRKSITWQIDDVSRVELIKQYDEKSPTLTIVFYDKNDAKIARVNGIYPMRKDGRLKTLLALRGIPMEVKSQMK